MTEKQFNNLKKGDFIIYRKEVLEVRRIDKMINNNKTYCIRTDFQSFFSTNCRLIQLTKKKKSTYLFLGIIRGYPIFHLKNSNKIKIGCQTLTVKEFKKLTKEILGKLK